MTNLEEITRALKELSEEERDVLRHEILPSLDEKNKDPIANLSLEEREKIEATLLDRSKGTFVEIEDRDDWIESVIRRGLKRVGKENDKYA